MRLSQRDIKHQQYEAEKKRDVHLWKLTGSNMQLRKNVKALEREQRQIEHIAGFENVWADFLSLGIFLRTI